MNPQCRLPSTRAACERPHLVVMFNVEKIGGAPETWGLIQVTEVAPQIGVVNNAFLVAFEEAHVNWVKPNQSGVQTHISLCDGGSSQVALTRQDVLHLHTSKHSTYSIKCTNMTMHMYMHYVSACRMFLPDPVLQTPPSQPYRKLLAL